MLYNTFAGKYEKNANVNSSENALFYKYSILSHCSHAERVTIFIFVLKNIIIILTKFNYKIKKIKFMTKKLKSLNFMFKLVG